MVACSANNMLPFVVRSEAGMKCCSMVLQSAPKREVEYNLVTDNMLPFVAWGNDELSLFCSQRRREFFVM